MLMGIADTFMLSALSDDAVSGVGAANQYLHIAILVLEVIGNGAAIDRISIPRFQTFYGSI